MPNIAALPDDKTIDVVQQAANSGSPAALSAVAPLVQNTSLQPAVENTIRGMSGYAVPVDRVVNAANEKGGVQTREGRLATADALLQEYKAAQPPKSFLRGLGLSLVGDPNAARAFSEGVQENYLAPGADGEFYRVIKNTNSGMPSAVLDSEGKVVPFSTAIKLGITGFDDVTKTIGYKAKASQTEQFIKDNAEEIKTANRVASGWSAIDNNNLQIMEGLSQLKNAGAQLPKSALVAINSIASKSGALAKTYSNSVNAIAQANDATSINNAIAQANEVGGQLGVPKIISVDANHNVKTDDGKSYSLSSFLQKANTFTDSTQTENAWKAGKAEIVNSEWYKNLAKTNPDLIPVFENVYNLSAANDVLKKTIGTLPILSPSVPFDPAKSLESNIAQSFIDQGNAKLAKAYAAKLSGLMQTGVPIVPGSVLNTFSQGREANDINKSTIEAMQKVLSSYKPGAEPQAVAEEQKPPSIKDRSVLSGAQNKRLERAEKIDVTKPNQAVQAVDEAELMNNLLKKHKKSKEQK